MRPVTRRNTVVKWLGVRNPTSREICAMDSSGVARECAGAGDPLLDHEAVGRQTRAVLEAAGEVVRAHVDHRTEVRQRQILIEVRLDMLGHPPQS